MEEQVLSNQSCPPLMSTSRWSLGYQHYKKKTYFDKVVSAVPNEAEDVNRCENILLKTFKHQEKEN